MNSLLRDIGYLEYIQTAIAKICRFTQDQSREQFLSDDRTQDAVIRNVEIIVEAVSKLSDDLKTKYPAIPWKDISGMRNRLIHEYNGVNLNIVWNTVQKTLPEFLVAISLIRSSENDGGGDGSGGGMAGGPPPENDDLSM